MAHIEGEILIHRPLEEVFDYVADERHEPTYNVAMTSSEKLTEGPIGVGSRFAATVHSGGRPVEMEIEFTGYDRPHRLASRTRMRSMDIAGLLTFRPEPDGTRMHWTWDVRPSGALRLLDPVVSWTGRRQERRIWTGLKDVLESGHPRNGRVEHGE